MKRCQINVIKLKINVRFRVELLDCEIYQILVTWISNTSKYGTSILTDHRQSVDVARPEQMEFPVCEEFLNKLKAMFI